MLYDYTDKIIEFWPTIIRAWKDHSDKCPIIECDLSAKTVAAYPANDYILNLGERTRQATEQQFRQVVDQGGIMVFIKDNENKKLQSYIFSSSQIDDIISPVV